MVKANLMPDEIKECRYSYCLNLNKYRILYKVFSLIWNCQHTSPIFSTDIELSNILRVSNYIVFCLIRFIIQYFHPFCNCTKECIKELGKILCIKICIYVYGDHVTSAIYVLWQGRAVSKKSSFCVLT